MSRWVIDAEHVVHERYCVEAGEVHLPYRTSLLLNSSAMTMQAWLQRPDTDRGHSAETMLRACKVCM